jgi:Cu(I)/Ag(I) efflux system membrane fusion protein
MNRHALVAALVAILAVGIAGGYFLALSSHEPASAAAPAAGRKVLYWHDPMVPNVKFDKPGKSPYMDMQLVPVYADDAPASAGAAVRIDPAVAQNLGIRTGKVERNVVESALQAVGSVTFDENLVELVQARVTGYVSRLHVRAPLERVRRGQPLADIVAPEWLAAQQEYLALRDATSERGQAVRAAARERLAVLGVPATAIAALDAGKPPGMATTIYSPADGVVSELGVRDGTAFAAGATLFRINGLTSVWVTAQVPESQVSLVPPHGDVTAHATAWPAESFAGHVVALLPDVDAATRTLAVRISIDNRAGKLAPGMFVLLDLAPRAPVAQLVVPSEAVIVTGQRTAVIVPRGAGGYDVVDVKTGTESRGRTVILEGLADGQSVVLSGQFLIDSEASLRSAVSRLGTQP